jgi:hypothetical protein
MDVGSALLVLLAIGDDLPVLFEGCTSGDVVESYPIYEL